MIFFMKKPTLIEEHNFPFESSISYGVEEGFHELHWHNEIEICYIRHGTGKYLINGIDYDFTVGDIFVIGNDDIHLCHSDNELIMQVVMFDPFLIGSGSSNPFDFEYLRPFIDNTYNECKKIDHKSECSNVLSEILLEIDAEYSSMKRGYEMMIKSLLLRFFTLIFRYYSENQSTKKTISANAVDKVRNILHYIDNNYSKHIDLALLEHEFKISSPYICSSFKSLTGISPMDYIIRKRITEAKRRLISTKKSIISISEECGFHSLSNFNSLFKRITGLTPSSYRKNNLVN